MLSFLHKISYSSFYLIPALIVSAFYISLHSLGKIQGKEELKHPSWSPLFKLFALTSSKQLWETTLFTLHLAKFVYYLFFGFISLYFIFLHEEPIASIETSSFYTSCLWDISLLAIVYLCAELLLSLLAEKVPSKVFKFLAFPSFILMAPFLPLTLFFFLCKKLLFPIPHNSIPQKLPFKLQEKLMDCLSESELNPYLDKAEKKLIYTVISFKDRIVREVMVPRIDIFSLSAETSIFEAARHFALEGYSRIPVYKESIDKMIGVLLYKDVLSIYTKHIETKQPLEALNKTVEHFIKPVLYTPETKKIAQLLQEFRNKQIHLAIVVDEYGGTEGIVTIEDILEELVGNIEDEYDTQEEKHFIPLASGGWIVDAKMSILDIEENLGIAIPTHAEYDTIGGYIFHKAGSIPSKGWKIHLDEVDLEILKSDERSVRKIKILPKNEKGKKST